MLFRKITRKRLGNPSFFGGKRTRKDEKKINLHHVNQKKSIKNINIS